MDMRLAVMAILALAGLALIATVCVCVKLSELLDDLENHITQEERKEEP